MPEFRTSLASRIRHLQMAYAAKEISAAHKRVDALEEKVCAGRFPAKEVDAAVAAKLLVPGIMQSYYLQLV